MEIDLESCKDTTVLVNLCGAGINEQRWTKKRKVVLRESRIDVTKKLFELTSQLPLEYYIGASGISAYGFDDGTVMHKEEDAFGSDFLSQLVKDWEQAADLFATRCKVAKIRIAVTLDKDEGAIQAMSKLVKIGMGAILGNGKQQIPWIAIEDLVELFLFFIEHQLVGTYNSNTGNCSNRDLMDSIATYYQRKIWLPAVPPFILRIVLGEMSDLVLKGSKACNDKLKKCGFYPNSPQFRAFF